MGSEQKQVEVDDAGPRSGNLVRWTIKKGPLVIEIYNPELSDKSGTAVYKPRRKDRIQCEKDVANIVAALEGECE